MNTPITDNEIARIMRNNQHAAQLRIVCRRLELDRAALMEALEAVTKDFTTYRQIAAENGVFGTWGALSLRQSESALAAARANFPES